MRTPKGALVVAHLDTNGLVTLSCVEPDGFLDYVQRAVAYEPANHAARPSTVEVVHLGDALDGWINEEGKYYLQAARRDGRVWRNMAATQLCVTHQAIAPADFITGPMVLTGSVGTDGDTLGLTDEQIAEICGVSGLPVVDLR